MQILSESNKQAIINTCRYRDYLAAETHAADIEPPYYAMPHQYREAFKRFETDVTALVLKGGRTGAKTQSAVAFLIEESYRQELGNQQIIIARLTKSSTDASVWFKLKSHIENPKMNVSADFNIGRNEITNIHTGCRFIFVGLYTTEGASKHAVMDRLKAYTCAYFWLEEAATVSVDVLRVLISTLERTDQMATYDDLGNVVADTDILIPKLLFSMNPVHPIDPVVAYVEHMAGGLVIHVNIEDIAPEFQCKKSLAACLKDKADDLQFYLKKWCGAGSFMVDATPWASVERYTQTINAANMEVAMMHIDPAAGGGDDMAVAFLARIPGQAKLLFWGYSWERGAWYYPEDIGRVVAAWRRTPSDKIDYESNGIVYGMRDSYRQFKAKPPHFPDLRPVPTSSNKEDRITNGAGYAIKNMMIVEELCNPRFYEKVISWSCDSRKTPGGDDAADSIATLLENANFLGTNPIKF